MLDIELFENINDNEVMELLQCIGIKTKTFKKNSHIIKSGSKIDYIGVVLEGHCYITDTTGTLEAAKIIQKLNINDIFGHNTVCCSNNIFEFDIITKESDCEILFLPFEKVVTPCQKLCKYHLQLIKNLMKILAGRNNILNNKIDIIGKKSIREKILALLKSYIKNGNTVIIPFNREEMAKFLCTDRCALSRELSKMQTEGIIKFKKNRFELL